MNEGNLSDKIEVKEYHGKDFGLFFEPFSVLYEGSSSFQQILVIETETLGKVLFLDGLVMFSEFDEFIYHEMLVHPALLTHPNPKNVLVIGGGDGGTVREVLKYPVEKIFLVEIDQEVIKISKKYFPEISRSFDSEKVKIVNDDGAKFLEKTREIFDIIIVDSSDPIGPSVSLFEKSFLKNVRSHLSSKGIYVSQSGSPLFHKDHLKDFFKTVKENFRIAKIYMAPVITYPGTIWTFTIASESIEPFDIKRTPPEELKFYNLEIHKSSFSLPNFLREILDR
ncbi:MAG: polyamine aminopropyltransferase [Candidatus Aminicenantia bacterium]